MVELKLSVERIQIARGERERGGLRFVKIVPVVFTETITTDRLLITEEAVRSLNSPSSA